MPARLSCLLARLPAAGLLPALLSACLVWLAGLLAVWLLGLLAALPSGLLSISARSPLEPLYLEGLLKPGVLENPLSATLLWQALAGLTPGVAVSKIFASQEIAGFLGLAGYRALLPGGRKDHNGV